MDAYHVLEAEGATTVEARLGRVLDWDTIREMKKRMKAEAVTSWTRKGKGKGKKCLATFIVINWPKEGD